ncbi:MAG: amino acid racemase [Candidatus Aenigmarchaeota archaeon]|nr:amino acid racemase [Candidatus Aenigmarchaeota archaeon]
MKTSEEPKFFKVSENVRSQKTVGVLGGFGPETTAEFYMSLIGKSRRLGDRYPKILINNIAVPFSLEEEAVKNAAGLEGFLPLLIEGVKLIEDKSDFIVLPCNTLHVFIDELRDASGKPVLSIIEETAKAVKSSGAKKVGLLASLKTFKSCLFDAKLAENGIEMIKPESRQQKRLSEIIHLILKGSKSNELKSEVVKIIGEMKNRGAENVILGCTDFQLLVKQEDSPLRLIDTMEVLAESVSRLVMGREPL